MQNNYLKKNGFFFLRVKAPIACLFIYLTWNVVKAHTVGILGEATD